MVTDEQFLCHPIFHPRRRRGFESKASKKAGLLNRRPNHTREIGRQGALRNSGRRKILQTSPPRSHRHFAALIVEIRGLPLRHNDCSCCLERRVLRGNFRKPRKEDA